MAFIEICAKCVSQAGTIWCHESFITVWSEASEHCTGGSRCQI